MKNQECKVRPEIININSINPIFCPFSVKINRCNGNCNNINDPYVRICLLDTVKNLNVKILSLMSKTNETRHIELHESWKCICRLNEIICNNKQRWNKDPSNCECECDKSCNIGQYLDYSDCKCQKKLIDPLIEECTENNDEAKLVNITLAENENSYCNSCKVYIVLMAVVFTILLELLFILFITIGL